MAVPVLAKAAGVTLGSPCGRAVAEGDGEGKTSHAKIRPLRRGVRRATSPRGRGKNATDLVQYAIRAYEEHWGYVWGTFGHVLTEGLFESKLAQYPDALSDNADFIRQTWVGKRTTDCVGLIKGYGWLDADTQEIIYNTNGMPDISANEMYHAATEKGEISTIPETPGLAVWHDGHIGVYIGNGEVVEAMGTRYGVVKTKLSNGRWTHWLKIPYIDYD